MSARRRVDRQAWIADRRAAVVAAYDSEASTFDENEYPAETQRQWIQRLLGLLPPGGLVLDAPCGTGANWSGPTFTTTRNWCSRKTTARCTTQRPW
jgi:hypothetical protein